MSRGAVYFNGSGGSITPQQCTRRWSTANSVLTEDTGGFARHANTVTGARHLLGVDFVPVAHTQIELLCKTRADANISGGIYGGVAARATGTSGAESGYSALLVNNGGTVSLRITKYNNPTATTLGTVAYTWATGEWHWIRFQLNGTSLKARAWKDGSAEPSTWNLGDTGAPITDSDLSNGDYAGPLTFGLGNIDHDYFSFGTGGDAAPDPSTATIEQFDSASAFQPIGFREHWDTANVATTEVAGGYARMVVGVQNRHLLAWDAIAPSANVEILTKLRASAMASGQPSFSLILRGSGATGAENGYRFSLFETAGSELRVSKFTAGTAADIGTNQAFTWAVDTWYWLRFRINGSTLTGKVWPAGTLEPASPQRTETDSAFSAAGFNGVLAFVVGNVDVDYMSYATGGSVASGPYELTAVQPIVLSQTTNLTQGAASSRTINATQAIALTQTTSLTQGLPSSTITATQAIVLLQGVNLRANPYVPHKIGAYYSRQIHQNVTKFSTFLGFDIALVFEFADKTTKTNLQNSMIGSGAIPKFWHDYNVANGKNFKLYVSIPTACQDSSVTDASTAAGTHDALWDAMAADMVSNGFGDALIRLGHEMNGNWFPYGANATDFKNAWIRVVTRFRLAAGQSFRFVWSPAIAAPNGTNPRTWYPGDSYVDIVAPDVYGQQYHAPNLTPQDMWDKEVFGYDDDTQHATIPGGPPAGIGDKNDPAAIRYGVRWHINEAKYHNKEFGFGENGSGHRPDRHGCGDTDIFWQKCAEMLDTWGPSTGAILGVFEKSWDEAPSSADYWSTFLEAQNVTGSPPNKWFKEKDRTAWAFRHYFGRGVLADLSISNFESAGPSGSTVVLEPGYGAGLNAVIPLGTPDGTKIGQITVANPSQHIWSLDAGESDNSSNTAGATGNFGNGTLSVTNGWLDDDGTVTDFPRGGQLTLRTDKGNALLAAGKKLRLGTRNGINGENVDLNVSVTRIAVGGTAKGWDYFDDETGVRPLGVTARWGSDYSISGLSTAPGFARFTAQVSSKRRAMVIDAIGIYGDIDVATAVRVSVLPASLTAAQSYGGVVVRGDGYETSETGYVAILGVIDAGGGVFTPSLIVRRYLNGTNTNLFTVPFSFVAGDFYEVRLAVSGTSPVTLKAKAWLASDAEPSSWMITTTDDGTLGGVGPIAAAGWAGTFAFFWQAGNVQYDFDYFGWDALGSGSSPVPPIGSIITANQPIVLSQTTSLIGTPPPVIGGLPIGTVGTGIYAGMKLVAGDEFTSAPSIWNFRNLTGKYASVGMHNATRRFNDYESQAFVDASYRGSRHQSPTDFGHNPFSVASSVLSITATPLTTVLSTIPTMADVLEYDSNTGVADVPDPQTRPRDLSGQLAAWPHFAYSGKGDFLFEAKLRMPTGSIIGYWPGFWEVANWTDYGEMDAMESWDDTNRHLNVSFLMPPSDGSPVTVYQLVRNRVSANRFVQIAFLKKGSNLFYYDDNVTAGTMVEVARLSTVTAGYAAAVDRIRGVAKMIMNLAISSAVAGTGTYNPAQWPKALEIDFWRGWTAASGPDNDTNWTYLPEVDTTPGGLWDASFPLPAALYGFVPDLEEIYILTDNIDNPGAWDREVNLGNNVPGNQPEGMLVDKVARTTGGTVPLTEGGRVGLIFWGSKNSGGPLKHIAKIWNVAPAVQTRTLFPNCAAAIGETFSRTIAYTDFHSGNLGPHTYQVSKVSGGADLTIAGNGTGTVTITGTIATAQVTVLKIECTNARGQKTNVTRQIDARVRALHYDFRYNAYRHNGVAYGSLSALIAAVGSFTQPLTGGIYARDLEGLLTQVTGANQPRQSNAGLAYEGIVKNLIGFSQDASGRLLTNVTVTANKVEGRTSTVDADFVFETATTGQHTIGVTVVGATQFPASFTAGRRYFASQDFKRGRGRRYVQLAMSTNAFPATAYANFDLQKGQVALQGAGLVTAFIEGIPQRGKGWWRCVMVADATITATGTQFFSGFCTTGTAGKFESYLGDVRNFCILASAQLIEGNQAQILTRNQTSGAFQKNADIFTITTIPAGVLSMNYVLDDGSLVTDTAVTPGSSYVLLQTLPRPIIREVYGLGAPESNISASQTLQLLSSANVTTISATSANIYYASQPLVLTQDAFLYLGPVPVGTIREELGGLNPQAVIEMFEYDDRNIGGAQTVRWHDGTTIEAQSITWRGVIYNPMPIQAAGFQLQLQGTLPRPTLTASNIGGYLGAYLRTMADGVGAKVTRRRTLAKYMDEINFPNGNPNADPNAAFPDEIYYVARKSSENAIFIELELAVAYDVIGVQLPRRQVIASTCLWVYRSADCGYSGPPVQDIEGVPTSDPAKDKCRKTLSACKARFGAFGVLNTSAFPASNLISGG